MTTVPEKWKWLFQPLGRSTRARLEICLGVVLTAAAMVGLSTVILPDPSKLATKIAISEAPSSLDRRAEGHVRDELPVAPKVSPVFANAVGRGDIDAMDELYSPGMPLDGMLSVAAESGAKSVVLWLLDRGADVHEDEGSVDAPVLVADAHPDVVTLLLERGAAEATLVTAAQASAPNAVLRLLSAHAPVNPTDGSPLYAAVSSTRGTPENEKFIIEKLLAAGADPNRDEGDGPLAVAVRACDASSDDHPSASDCLTIARLLLKHGARTTGMALLAALALEEPARDVAFDALLTARLEPGATAFALAGWSAPTPVIKRLAAKGIDWAWHDGEDDAALPLLAAVQRGDRDYVRALLDAGAPADVHYKDATCALGVAIDGAATGNGSESARLVELLLARGAGVNRRLPDGRTPLFAAAQSGELRIVNALLDRGARLNDVVLDDTALDGAEQANQVSIARVLHARGGRRARKTGCSQGD